VSDDGDSAIVVIALVGNPFSPAYARARQRGAVRAELYCSMNVALYGRGASAWSLAERRVGADDRGASGVVIGKSSMRWEGDRVLVEIDERTTPSGRPLRGKIVLHPEALPGLEHVIDERTEHRWWPVAPLARIEVDFSQPRARFSGHGYHDVNAGDVPLESTFERWNWARARTDDRALVMYDVSCPSGAPRSLALCVSPNGAVEPLDGVSRTPLRRTVWGLERSVPVDNGHEGREIRSLEDGPFYARSLVETRIGGRRVLAVHETLAADRLRRRWVRFLAGFRMRTFT
jgi:carotenoid 1,2-hydratase